MQRELLSSLSFHRNVQIVSLMFLNIKIIVLVCDSNKDRIELNWKILCKIGYLHADSKKETNWNLPAIVMPWEGSDEFLHSTVQSMKHHRYDQKRSISPCYIITKLRCEEKNQKAEASRLQFFWDADDVIHMDFLSY